MKNSSENSAPKRIAIPGTLIPSGKKRCFLTRERFAAQRWGGILTFFRIFHLPPQYPILQRGDKTRLVLVAADLSEWQRVDLAVAALTLRDLVRASSKRMVEILLRGVLSGDKSVGHRHV